MDRVRALNPAPPTKLVSPCGMNETRVMLDNVNTRCDCDPDLYGKPKFNRTDRTWSSPCKGVRNSSCNVLAIIHYT